MKPQWQQQQERWRQQQMQAAWQEQQKAQAEQAIRTDERNPFGRVEEEVRRLRRELAAGRLSDARFKESLRELMVQDGRGTWWMMGYETGVWYRHDGTNWVRDDPPGHRLSGSTWAPPELDDSVQAKPRRLWGAITFFVGLFVTFWIGIGFAFLTGDIADGWVGAIFGWGLGLVLAFVFARRVWRRE